jgi:hypothetical protein
MCVHFHLQEGKCVVDVKAYVTEMLWRIVIEAACQTCRESKSGTPKSK